MKEGLIELEEGILYTREMIKQLVTQFVLKLMDGDLL